MPYHLKYFGESRSLELYHNSRAKLCWQHPKFLSCGTWCPLFSIRKSGLVYYADLHCAYTERTVELVAMPLDFDTDFAE